MKFLIHKLYLNKIDFCKHATINLKKNLGYNKKHLFEQKGLQPWRHRFR